MKQGLKTAISWNKYRSEITTQPKNNNLDFMIDPTLIQQNGGHEPTRNSFEKYYMPLVEDFSTLIDINFLINQ